MAKTTAKKKPAARIAQDKENEKHKKFFRSLCHFCHKPRKHAKGCIKYPGVVTHDQTSGAMTDKENARTAKLTDIAETIIDYERQETIERIRDRINPFMEMAEKNWEKDNRNSAVTFLGHFDLWKDIDRALTPDEPQWIIDTLDRCEANGVDITPLLKEFKIIPFE